MNNLNESYKKHSRLFLLVFIFLAAVVILVDIMLVANRNAQIYKSKAATSMPKNAVELAQATTEPTVEEIVKLAAEYPSFTAFMDDLDLSFPDQLNLLDALGNEAVSRLASASAGVDKAIANPQTINVNDFKKLSSDFLDAYLAQAATYVYIVRDIYNERYEIVNSSPNVKGKTSRTRCIELGACKDKYSYDDDLTPSQKKAVDTLPKGSTDRELAIDGFGLANSAIKYATGTGDKDPEALGEFADALSSADIDLYNIDPNKAIFKGRQSGRNDLQTASDSITNERLKLAEKKNKEQDEKIANIETQLTTKQTQLEQTQADLKKELTKGTAADEELLKKLLKDKEELIEEIDKLKKEIEKIKTEEKELETKAKEETPSTKPEESAKQQAYCQDQDSTNQALVGNCKGMEIGETCGFPGQKASGSVIEREGFGVTRDSQGVVTDRDKFNSYVCMPVKEKAMSTKAGEVAGATTLAQVGILKRAGEKVGEVIKEGAEDLLDTAGDEAIDRGERGIEKVLSGRERTGETGKCICTKKGKSWLKRAWGWITTHKKYELGATIIGGVVYHYATRDGDGLPPVNIP